MKHKDGQLSRKDGRLDIKMLDLDWHNFGANFWKIEQ